MSSRAGGTGSWLAFLHLDGRRLWIFLALCAGLAVLETLGDAGRELLRYERDAIAAGEWWRLLTGHVVHLGWRHFALNVMGLALMWALFFPDYSPARWAVILLASVLAIDVAFLAIERQIDWYVGLSGSLHGVMVAGTVAHIRRRERDAFILAPFLVIKLAWEQLGGAMPYSSDPGGNVVVDAHLYGALGGLLASLFPVRRTVARPML
jgi:rhomboid family GlyGly-CTERM serine protease